MSNNLKYKLALSMLPGIGGVLSRNLVSYCGSLEAVFSEPFKSLKKIPGIGEVNARRIKDKTVWEKVDRELDFIEKYKIGVHFYTDKSFPRRLSGCIDAPVLIYTKGILNLNEEKVVSIVGTRNATDYGKRVVDELVHSFA